MPPRSRPVTFRFHDPADHPVGHVELLGEPQDWLHPIPMRRSADPPSDWVAQLDLPEGVYSFKFRADGDWQLAGDATRTRSRWGHRNQIVSVGGTPEPLLFAPAAPWLFVDLDGALVVTAALRKGASTRLMVLWGERGDLDHAQEASAVFEEDDHVLMRARLPVSSSSVRLAFELDAGMRVGSEHGAAFEVPLREVRCELPSWWRDAVIYTVFVDRFRPAQDRADWCRALGPDEPAGGHLEGLRRSLPELRDLGVNVLYLTPVHVGANCHRYDLVDPMRVDPALGGDEAFDRLLRDAHDTGMRVLVDLSFCHAGRGFPPYEHVLEHGRASPFASWFLWEGDPAAMRQYGKRHDAPLLDLDHPQVRELALEVADRWARTGVDGFRLDAAAEVPWELARAIRQRLRAVRSDGVVLGEVVPAHAWRWRQEGAVDAATDFTFHALAGDWIATRTIDAPHAARRLLDSELLRGAGAAAAVRFLSTHDHPRFSTLAGMSGGAERTALGLLFLLSMPGVPALLYGEEIGMSSTVAELEPETVWRDRAPMPWTDDARDPGLRALVRRLLAARASSLALREGDLSIEFAEGHLMVLRRSARGETVDVVIHAGSEPVELDLDDDRLDRIEPLVSVGHVVVRGQSVMIGPEAGVILRRGRSSAGSQRVREQVRANLALLDQRFRASVPAPGTRPVRIDLSVTEQCNLRCEHCINESPRHTREGSARRMIRAVLERLRDDFAHASYVGFVHGGESLSAPIFWDVLQVLREARDGLPTTVHLLSNGMLLDATAVERFVELGGSSVMVSLDGARPGTNDSLRVGCRLEVVAGHLREAVRLRRDRGWNLRLGLSCVVMRRNLSELTELMELAASIGVDWVKLEELVIKSPLAARERVGDQEALEASQRAAQRGRALGLVVVEHVAPPPVWICRLGDDPEATRFLADDEYANRSRIHPCRAIWEHACVDPNGDVRIADFWGPVIGNVMDRTLEELWSLGPARAERERAMESRPCRRDAARCPSR